MVSKHLHDHNEHRVSKRRQLSGHRKTKRLAQAAKEREPQPIHRLPSPPSDQPVHNFKRKSPFENEHSTREGSLQKKNRRFGCFDSLDKSGVDEDNQYGGEIRWEDYFSDWPPAVVEQTMSTREPRAAKRSHTPSRSASDSQRVRDGDSPAAWTRKHEEKMEEAGLFMTADRTQAAITEECQKLCEKLLQAEYAMPADAPYRQDRLAKVLRRFRNEARVVRDVTPIVVPSPELLHIDGHAELDDVCEAMNAEWTQSDTLCGPRPKPDFVTGLSAAAFTKEEREKLQMSHTSACPNLFPENIDRPIEEAERQAMHSASIATRAVVELFRKISATAEVHEKILAFSVAHNHSMVMIFAHFATVNDQQTSFFRRLLHLHRFAEDLESTAWTKSYQIIRAIYEHFVPRHLARIQGALSRMRSPSLASFATQLGIDEDSQASTPDQSSSQEDGRFKKPLLPSMTKLQEENDKLRDRLLELLREQQAEAIRQRQEQHETKAMMEEQLAQQKTMMEKQLAQQEEESREQKTMMEKQLAQHREESREQKTMMETQLAEQNERSHEQKIMMEDQLKRQREQMEKHVQSRARRTRGKIDEFETMSPGLNIYSIWEGVSTTICTELLQCRRRVVFAKEASSSGCLLGARMPRDLKVTSSDSPLGSDSERPCQGDTQFSMPPWHSHVAGGGSDERRKILSRNLVLWSPRHHYYSSLSATFTTYHALSAPHATSIYAMRLV
ncbi:hypothetical protein M409DRAFT_61395 [Zasmidium cellare ATCC 36951]|uniref:DUF7924 domain-containing protein n=1 Tax=Zasmidium cellare ATCC 36951 TaxID=1080233 RepID=A0A6A6BZ93_ZASCE|nr:uncharacterized protein M409DRAFT_61395 [Zasmidium cellare ATCC 36951]KAF2158736.1 hypothetical protein M409DRAFT_61395 [Zasmidium cellare ATCC 36951]